MARKRRKCEAAEAAGLPPVADLTPAELQKKANRKGRNTRHRQKMKDAKLRVAQHGHIDIDE